MSSLSGDRWEDDISAGPCLESEEQEIVTPGAVGGEDSSHLQTAKSVVGEVLETVVLTLIVFFLIQIVVRNFRVLGSSMEPNLHDGQYLIIDKISYRLGEPTQGDVVVFEPPTRPGEDYVKRIIGLPGQLVEVRNGQVLVNDTPLAEPYVVRPASYSMAARRVGPDEYFVLGDNRNSSSDSHTWGMLPRENIVGRAWLSYWPPDMWGLIGRNAPTQSTTLFQWLENVF